MRKPIIGLVTKHKDIDKKRTLTYICDEMKDAIFYNGGIAIGIIPSMKNIVLVNQTNEYDIYTNLDSLFSLEEKENLISQIKMCDGIILSGGTESDAYEMFIAKYCYENNIPIMGICAGHNNIVRGIGGRTKPVDNVELHLSKEDYVHYVNIDKYSNFYSFVDSDKFMVNSRHKNTIADLGCLTAVGFDEQGNIEVTEDKSKKCYLGIRFHPESLYLIDKNHNNIFRKFIEVCRK